MKKISVVVAIVALALAVSACTPPITVQTPTMSNDGTTLGISVSGVGEVTGTPDTLTMSFGVSVIRDSVSEAVSVAAEKAEAVITSLKANGVAEEDIQTANYAVYPQYDWSNNAQRLVGYQVSNSVNAKIRDLATAGTVIDGATAAGGDETTVSGVFFSIEDNEALIEAAREAAWNDAKQKAEHLASLAGVTLGDPVTIAETFTPSPQPLEYRESVYAMADGGVSTPITPGEQQVAVSLSVQFSITR